MSPILGFIKMLTMVMLILIAMSCDDDDQVEMGEEDEPSYLTCCQMAAIQDSVGIGRVYIPNIFTPNHDGLNDVFVVFANSAITEVKHILIRDEKGNTVFEDVNLTPNDPHLGWDGLVDTSFIMTVYSFEVEVESTDGSVKTIQGEICSFPCRDDEPVEPFDAPVSQCQFGTQHDGAGRHDPYAPSFEELDCLN